MCQAVIFNKYIGKLLLATFLLARALSLTQSMRAKHDGFLLVTRAEINCDDEALLMEPRQCKSFPL